MPAAKPILPQQNPPSQEHQTFLPEGTIEFKVPIEGKIVDSVFARNKAEAKLRVYNLRITMSQLLTWIEAGCPLQPVQQVVEVGGYGEWRAI